MTASRLFSLSLFSFFFTFNIYSWLIKFYYKMNARNSCNTICNCCCCLIDFNWNKLIIKYVNGECSWMLLVFRSHYLPYLCVCAATCRSMAIGNYASLKIYKQTFDFDDIVCFMSVCLFRLQTRATTRTTTTTKTNIQTIAQTESN